MFFWGNSILFVQLVPNIIFLFFFYYSFFFFKKKIDLFMFFWTRNIIAYYFAIFVLLFYITSNLVSDGAFCVIVYYTLSMLYIISITYFFKQYFIVLPLFMNLSVFYFYFYIVCDFMYLFMAFELTSTMIGFMYILSVFKKSYNVFAINLILLNFFNFIISVLFLSFFYQYYGTTNLPYITNLYEGSVEEYFILTLLFVFILFKVGHLPSFFIKCDIYSKMPLGFLLSYTFFYLIFIIPVCAFFTLFIYNTIGYSTVFVILFLFTSLFCFTILNRYEYTDFLVSSTVIFTTFVTILLFA